MQLPCAFPAMLALTIVACAEDDLGTTTFSTFVTTQVTASSPTTVVTVSAGPDVPTSSGPFAEETTGDVWPDTTDETSGGDPESTGTTNEEPIPDFPGGCGHLVEMLGRGATDERFVVVDMSGCPRAAVPTLRLETTPDQPDWEIELPHRPCGVFGGLASPAAVSDDGVVIPLGTEVHDDAVAWRYTVLIDGAPTDDVRVPGILKGQDWNDKPDAPKTPVRRREDFSVVPVAAHAEGCSLMPVP